MTARELALSVLYETEEKNGYLNVVFKHALLRHPLSCADTAFAKELVFGVFRHKMLLDAVIRKHSGIRLKKIEPHVLNSLRLSVYQIYFLDKVPDHAAVSEAVSMVKPYGNRKTPGFVNALLRSVLLEKGDKKHVDLTFLNAEKKEYLSVKHSYPLPLATFFVDTFGVKRAESLMQAGNETPRLSIRANTLKITREELKDLFLKEGVLAEDAPYVDTGLFLTGATEEVRNKFSDLFTVQDQSAQIAALMLSPKKNDVVIDLCAAPGGKTTHIAELMEDKGKILAFDLYEKRVLDILENKKRLGLLSILAKRQDACELNESLRKTADKIMLDVPCSGLGIIRRKPDIKYKENLTDFTEILSVQRTILNNAKRYLKKGGVLLYATCTLNPKENEEMIEAFLKENPDFKIEGISSPHILGEMKTRAETGMVTIFPDTDKSDGFFMCRLKKQ